MRALKLKTVDLLERLALPEQVFAMAEDLFQLLGRRKPLADFPYYYKRILVIEPDLIGDVVLTSALLRELRSIYPASWITLVVEPHVFNLVEHCPHVNEVLTYDCKNWQLYWRWKFCLSAAWLSLRHLFRRKFDLAIFPHWDVDHYYGTMLAYLSGAIYRIGFSEGVNSQKHIDNRNYNMLLSHALEETEIIHEVERKLSIIRALGCLPASRALEVWLSRDDEAFAQRFLQARRQKKGALLVAICLGGSQARKLWPVERFQQVAQWLIDTMDAEILVIGSLVDQRAGRQLKAALGKRVINSSGLTTIRQAAALLKNCHLYLGNDTGPMHLAAALKLPVVAVSCHPQEAAACRAYSPGRFGPWGVPHRVLQPPQAFDKCANSGTAEDGLTFCDYCISNKAHCILGVTVEAVKEALSEILQQEHNLQRPLAPVTSQV
jgi:ADP-heptose:LPS heptosyltransferase